MSQVEVLGVRVSTREFIGIQFNPWHLLSTQPTMPHRGCWDLLQKTMQTSQSKGRFPMSAEHTLPHLPGHLALLLHCCFYKLSLRSRILLYSLTVGDDLPTHFTEKQKEAIAQEFLTSCYEAFPCILLSPFCSVMIQGTFLLSVLDPLPSSFLRDLAHTNHPSHLYLQPSSLHWLPPMSI